MGEQRVEQGQDERRSQDFMKALLNDLAALERMLDEGRIETGVRRMGAEQEMFLVDSSMRPAPLATEVIGRLTDPRFTPEIARFNLEANLTPRTLAADCFRQLEQEINEVIRLVREAARPLGADVLLAGILPTLQRRDLTLDSITPAPRYYQLNDAVMGSRGGDVSVHMKGLDEIHLSSDNIMPLSSNTSFQVHLQVGPEEFVPMYNAAQAVTAPVLAAAVNSPVWLGSRLWQETRVALFQHSADSRTRAEQERQNPTRVGFGERWLTRSVLELFREDVARFRVILTNDVDEDSMEVLAAGGVPRLKALSLHNGTVWWWNRPCYGVGEGRAHLRIENRVLPSGPTPLDETANAAFLIGLTTAFPSEYGDIGKAMSFDDAKTNFWAAARHGLKAQFSWAGGRTQAAGALILEHLLPLARAGLKSYGVDSSDVDRYLGTIEERVRTRQTGAQWALRSLAALGPASGEHNMRALAAAMHANQRTGEPVHRWPLAGESGDAGRQDWVEGYRTVGQFMTTDLFTVRPDDLVDLAACVMDWKHVRHVPVEDGEGRLVGLVSHRDIVRLLARRLPSDEEDEPVLVSGIMSTDPVTASPDTPTLEAIALMRGRKVGCLPVVENGLLVGIVTAQDFLAASARLFEERLGPREPSPDNRIGEKL